MIIFGILILVIESVDQLICFFFICQILTRFSGSLCLRSFGSAGAVEALFLIELNIVGVQILSISESVGGSTSSVSDLSQILIVHRPSNIS